VPGRDSQARDGAALLCQSMKCPYPRAGAGALVREPRVRRSPLEGGVSPRARWSPLEGAFDRATPVGRGGHRSVGRALCACLGKRCVLFFCFLQVLSSIPPVL
jgi:hypothetical protein